MAYSFNYESVFDEKSQTYTVKDVEVFAAGRWRGRGTPPEGLAFSEADLDVIVETDEKLHDYIRPVLKETHDSEDGTVAGELVGGLGKLKRSGSKLVADFVGLSQEVYDRLKKGLLGRVSPELRGDWVESATGTRCKLAMTGVAFTGSKMPAVTKLLPIVTFDSGGSGAMLLLEYVDAAADAGQTQPQGAEEGGTTVADEAKLKEREDAVAASEKALADREKFLGEEAKSITRRKLTSAWRVISGQTGEPARANPSDEERFIELGMALDDCKSYEFVASDGQKRSGTHVDRHIEDWMARPAIKPKQTEPKGKGTGGEADPTASMTPSEKFVFLGEQMVETKKIDFVEAIKRIEVEQPKLYQEYRAECFKRAPTMAAVKSAEPAEE